jgi:radical SAM protein with 4Fe4S-binding SPASM domain
MKAIMLVITEKCNLTCRYCYEASSHSAVMTFERAKQIIETELLNCQEEEIKIFFFGGEAFTQFELIKNVYDFVKNRYNIFRSSFAVTTNGTLVHGDIKKWLSERADDFEVTLSLDGTPEMHNRNRIYANGVGSFADIDLDFFTRTWPNCVAKMTISDSTFADFSEGIRYIESMGFYCKANFASGVNFELHQNKKVLQRNMECLIDYYTKYPEKKLCYMLDLDLRSILVPLNEQFRYCGAGVDRRCYGANGTWYPCQGLMPMSTGKPKKLFREETFLESSVLTDSKCSECKGVRICKTCYASNYMDTGYIYQPGQQTCLLNRVCMVTSARIQYNRLLNKGKELTNEDKQLIKAIFIIAGEWNRIFETDI